MLDETTLWIRLAIKAKADDLEKGELVVCDKLATSDLQTSGTREYFKTRVELLKHIIQEMRTVPHD